MRRLKLIFVIMFTIQLIVPLSMIIEKEVVLNKGETIKFQVRPIDPYDAFRGKYLSIGIVENRVITNTENYREGQDVYASIVVDSDGFGKPAAINTEPYENEQYIKCKIDYVSEDSVVLNFPFDRFYINEEYSELGEELYSQYSSGEKEDAYISVRISRGKSVLEKMFLSGIEINDFIKQELQKSQ